jgi:hypothetical protein
VAKLANAAVCKTAIIGSNPIRASITADYRPTHNLLATTSAIEAFICGECGEGVAIDRPVQ